MASTVTMATAFDNAIQQTLDKRVHYWQDNLSSKFRSLVRGGGDVVGQWGQGYVLRKKLRRGLGGAVAAGPMQNQSVLMGTADTVAPNFGILGKTAGQWAPPVDAGVHPDYFQFQVPLYKASGFVGPIELELKRLAAEDMTKAQIIMDIMDGSAEQMARFNVNSFWAETKAVATKSSTYTATLEGCVLGAFATGADDITIKGDLSANSLKGPYTLTDGAIARFREGMQVDVICATGTNHQIQRVNAADLPLFIGRVDPLGNKIWLLNRNRADGDNVIKGDTATGLTGGKAYLTPWKALDNQAWSAATAAATITLSANTTFLPQLPFALERFLKSSGGLLGTGTTHATASAPSNSIDLAKFPDYKSYVIDAAGVALDETFLLGLAARLQVAGYTQESMPNEFIVEPGAITGFAGALDGLFVHQRQGETIDIKAGMKDPDRVSFNGMGGKIDLIQDRFVGMNKAYGTRDGSLQEIGPTRLPGAGSGPGGYPSRAEFWAQAIPGNNSIWISVWGDGTTGGAPTGEITTMIRAPYFYPIQYWTENLRGALITNVGTSYGAVG